MKKFLTPLLLLAAAATLQPNVAEAADTLGEPAIQFKSARGAREKASDRYVQVYLKSSVPDTTFYIAFDDSIVPLSMVKANTLYNKKVTVSKPEVTVKIYGKTINFINFNTMDAYDVKIGEDGNNTIAEFRCEGDSIDSFDFVTGMKALTYLVGNNNGRLRDVTIKSQSLQRIRLGSMPSATSFTIEAPEAYEFYISSGAKIPSLDMSKCPKLKTFTCYNMSQLSQLTLGKQDSLAHFAVTGSQLPGLKFENYPLLSDVTFHTSPLATYLEFVNCPVLTKITANSNGFESFAIANQPKLTSINVNQNPLKSLTLDVPSLTALYCDATQLKSVDLSKLTSARTVWLRNGVLENITLSQEAAENTLTNLDVSNNCFTLVDLPPRGKAMQPKSSYQTPSNYYAPQQNPQIPTNLNVGDKIDMSKYAYGRLFATDSVVPSEIKWTTIFDEDLEEGVDYKVENGVYTFLKAQDDSVACTVTNSEFSWFKNYTDTRGTVHDYRIITNYTLISQPTGIDGVTTGAKAVVRAAGNQAIAVSGANGAQVVVADLAGRVVWNARLSNDATLAVPASGLYVVAVGSERFKVLVK